MSDSPDRPSADVPLMIFDGDCAFCRAAVDRWREATGPRIQFAPYQEVGAKFSQIREQAFRRAVHLVDTDGTVHQGAEAVFWAMAHCGRKRWLLEAYQRVPPFAFAAQGTYRLIAANRGRIATIQRIWYGGGLKRPTYHVASALFLRLLGLIYLIAFVSLWTQIDGLVGDHGILPVKNYFDAIERQFAAQNPAASPVWHFPTLLWLSPHDGFLNLVCGAGTLLAVLLIFGVLPIPATILLWLCYLSLLHVGQVFLSFQWDILLLETGFIAIFLAPFVLRSKFLADRHPPRLAIWLVWWLLFRLMLESGAVKLTWDDAQARPDLPPVANVWESLTALDFHYWTQPLPTWTSWYAARFPLWFQKLSVIVVFVVELALPWLIFAPRPLRYVACGGILLLMVLISGTGNYNFFTLLTALLALAVLDDRAWPQFLQRRITGTDWPVLAAPTRWRTVILVPFAGLALLLGASQVREAIAPHARPSLALESDLNISQFFLVNGYGLFRQMTETRPEIVIEGSPDGTDWKTYEFRWKPGELSQRPRFVMPHQPRLDWQMWFEALRLEEVYKVTRTIDPRHMSFWFQLFLKQLMQGEPIVIGLLEDNPFPTAPPKFVRITLYQYRFTDGDEGRQTGNWWRRDQVWVGPGWSLPP